ncbi:MULTISPECIES: hypothetical protein [Lactobacillales]|nr:MULTISPECIES: hypothetical protein [Lactobacillales]MCJ2168137.1 hypothetical protein [Leuconostoc citreum]MDY5162334.1 hypothetical protein [Leuconostoc citreum]MDY5165904.1 hypothetical protein [Leuconostoc citreum]
MSKNKDTEYRYIKTQIRLIIKSIIQTLKADLESVEVDLKEQVYRLYVPQQLISSTSKSLLEQFEQNVQQAGYTTYIVDQSAHFEQENTVFIKLTGQCTNHDHKKLTQYLINENAYIDSTSFKDLEHVRIKADQKYHGI